MVSPGQDAAMIRRVLMIAYHFPPVQGSSGVQRTLKFAQYLPQFGWEPLVLTVHPRAYAQTTAGQLHEIPKHAVVERAFALDTARHLALAGRYPGWLAIPDRWISWWLSAVPAGLRLIREYRPAAIWSTYPIATAHLIGYSLHRLTKLPWIADFRDSMTEDHYPRDPIVRRSYRAIERRAVTCGTRAVFTTPGAVRMYAERYPEVPDRRWCMIPNGYDEENFVEAEAATAERRAGNTIELVHSGLLYPSERDPSAFFTAMSALKRSGRIRAGEVRVILRATGHDEHYRSALAQHGLEDLVVLAPALPYRQALAEMLGADGLLIFQAANCNHQVPAKIYEYLRARRPIFALTDAGGDTAAVLHTAGIDTIVPLDSAPAIERGLVDFIERVRAGQVSAVSDAEIARHSRRAGAAVLAGLLDSAADGGD